MISQPQPQPQPIEKSRPKIADYGRQPIRPGSVLCGRIYFLLDPHHGNAWELTERRSSGVLPPLRVRRHRDVREAQRLEDGCIRMCVRVHIRNAERRIAQRIV